MFGVTNINPDDWLFPLTLVAITPQVYEAPLFMPETVIGDVSPVLNAVGMPAHCAV